MMDLGPVVEVVLRPLAVVVAVLLPFFYCRDSLVLLDQ